MRVEKLVRLVQTVKVVEGEFDFPLWEGKRGFVVHILTDMNEKAAYKFSLDQMAHHSDMREDGIRYGIVSLFA